MTKKKRAATSEWEDKERLRLETEFLRTFESQANGQVKNLDIWDQEAVRKKRAALPPEQRGLFDRYIAMRRKHR